jgi:hypothetical protein
MLTSGNEVYFGNQLWQCGVNIQRFGDSLVFICWCYDFCFSIFYIYHITWWNKRELNHREKGLTTITWIVGTDKLCPMVPQQSMPGEDTCDHLTLPTVPSVVCCGPSGNLLYDTNTVCRYDIVSILDNEYGDNLWNVLYWLHTDMASRPRRHRNFCPVSEGFLWEYVTISFVDFS